VPPPLAPVDWRGGHHQVAVTDVTQEGAVGGFGRRLFTKRGGNDGAFHLVSPPLFLLIIINAQKEYHDV